MTAPGRAMEIAGTTFTSEDIAHIQARLLSDGYAYVTPANAAFDYVGALSMLGFPLPQYHGALLRDVRPDPNMSNDVYSASNTRELLPHTEWYEFPGIPPRYVGLWCIQPAEGPGGETTIADAYQILEQFTADERRLLRERVYQWRSGISLEKIGVLSYAEHPFVEPHLGSLVVRFSSQDILLVDDEIQGKFIEAARRFFETSHIAINIERNAILIWDNWRMMHGRNAFSDPRRHLRRILLANPA